MKHQFFMKRFKEMIAACLVLMMVGIIGLWASKQGKEEMQSTQVEGDESKLSSSEENIKDEENRQMEKINNKGNINDQGGVGTGQIEGEEKAEDSILVNSTLPITGGKLQAEVVSGKIKIGTKEMALDPVSKMVDEKADLSAKQIYAYLKAIGKSDCVIYGHQSDTWHKAGVKFGGGLTSDTKDVTGSISGVVGIDGLSLCGNEYSAVRYNREMGGDLPKTPAGNVKAAALLTNENIKEGAIITLSVHMPNFSMVTENADYQDGSDPSYAKYDFSGYTPNKLTGDVVNQILPGGTYNEVFKAYLDMIADYAGQVEGAILFRPFHENTGSWFWWGKDFCTPETFKNVYRYTVEYLRDEKNIHNFIYVYGPGCEAGSIEDYAVRYPGDDYVDMVGFDMYDWDPTEKGSWMEDFKNELSIVDSFAKAHQKLVAVTETGLATSKPDEGDHQTALHMSGNQDKDWYNEVLNIVSDSEASYYLLWANFGKFDGFYTPFVEKVNEDGTLYGHELLDEFIDFFNDERSIFAVNQKQALETLAALKVQ